MYYVYVSVDGRGPLSRQGRNAATSTDGALAPAVIITIIMMNTINVYHYYYHYYYD